MNSDNRLEELQLPEVTHQQNEYIEALRQTALTLLDRLEISNLLEGLLTRAVKLSGAPHGFIALIRAGRSPMLIKVGTNILNCRLVSIEPGVGFIGKVWQNRQPLLLEDYLSWEEHLPDPAYDCIRSIVGVPLQCNGEVAGVMGLFAMDEKYKMGKNDLALLNRFAELAALALENDRLYNTVQRRLSELAVVQRVAQTINSTLQLDEIFHTIVSQVNTAFGYEMVSIYVRLGSHLALKAHIGLQKTVTDITIEQGVTGRVVRSAKAEFVNDVRQDQDYIMVEEETRQLIAVPLKSRNEQVLGALVVGSKGQPTLTNEDFDLLQLLANQISVAVENAHLFVKLRQSETKYRQVINSLKEIIFQTDSEGKWTFLNPAWQEVLGYRVDETLGKRLFDYLHPDDHEITRRQFRHIIQKKQEYCQHQARYLTKTGEVCWLELNFRLMSNGGKVNGTTGTITNITERKQSELLNKSYSQILEMIARKQALPHILEQVSTMIETARQGDLHSLLLLKPDQNDDSLHGYRFINETASSDWWDSQREFLTARGLKACWSMPILSNKNERQLLGLFAIYYPHFAEPNSSDVKLIEMAASLATIAIEQQRLSDELIHHAYHDALTGLANRLLLEEKLGEILRGSYQQHKVAILFLDLDRFKLINDTLGHSIGDILLQQIAHRLQGCLRKSDLIARMGGDEFVVVLPRFDDLSDIEGVAQKLLSVLELPFEIGGQELRVTFSIGISIYPDNAESVKELLAKADHAMYWVKKQGRNNYQFFAPEMNTNEIKLLELQNHLRKAIELDELKLHFQPQIDLLSGRTVAVEALLRWQHRFLGSISPTKFIPLAEESGLIVPIGSWALQEAVRKAKQWREAGHPPLKIVVNVSALQFRRPDFVPFVNETLEFSGIDPHYFELELTESLLMQNTAQNTQKFVDLKTLGVSLAIDDFGTGFSSLSYLQRLPIDTIKIDRSFVQEVNESKADNNQAIIKAITTMAHSLGMEVVAEGVETTQQLEFLRGIGCDRVQGFLFSPAVPVFRVENWQVA